AKPVAGDVGHSDTLPRFVPLMWWRDYIGKPFKDGARGPDAYDCWGVCQAVYRDRLGVSLPSYGEISAHDLARVAREMERGKDDGWQAVTEPQEYDVAIMRSGRGGRAIVHVGVMVDSRRVLHIEQASHAVVVPVTHYSIAGRIAGYRRWAS